MYIIEIEKLGFIQILGILTNTELNTKLQNTLIVHHGILCR